MAGWPGPARGGRIAGRGGANVVEAVLGVCRKAPRSQVGAWLRDLTIGSKTSLGSVVIASCLGCGTRGLSLSSRTSLFAQGL
jgi:hypothetical protein